MTQGELLKQLRLRAGMTQERLADAAGVRQGQISGVEVGRNSMGVSLAKRLGPALKVHWAVFFDDENRNVDNAS